MVRLAHHKMKMKLLEEAVADSSPSTSSSSRVIPTTDRKRKAPKNPPPEVFPRLSKRSKVQFIAYQSPESVEKITIAFTEQLSKHKESILASTNGSSTSTNNNNSNNEGSKATKKSKSEPTTAETKSVVSTNKTKGGSTTNKNAASAGPKSSAKSSLATATKKKAGGETKTKKKNETVQSKSTKTTKTNAVQLSKPKTAKAPATTGPTTTTNSNKSKAQVKPKVLKVATPKNKSKVSVSAKIVNRRTTDKTPPTTVDNQIDQTDSPTPTLKKKPVARKKKPVENKLSIDPSTLDTQTKIELNQNVDNGETPKKKKKAIKRKNEEVKGEVEEIKKEEPKSKKKVRRQKGTFNPKPFVTEYKRDPTFEEKGDIPHVSALADSRLLIRAVLLKDNNLLQSLVKNAKKNSIYSLCVPRSLNINRDALSYAYESENIPAIKFLTDGKSIANNCLAPSPELILQKEKTGHNSAMMFGHGLRSVELGRGGKEGNNAFNKDNNLYGSNFVKQHNYPDYSAALSFDISYSTIEKLNGLQENSYFLTNCINSVNTVVRRGNVELAGKLIQEGNKREGFGFNLLFEEVLLKNGQPLTPFKSVSVVKKATGNGRLTPLHCSAINPNPMYLNQLLSSRPEFTIHDSDNWTLLHYAAVCKGPGPLQSLLNRGAISTLSINKRAETPLHLACELGRIENVRLIVQYEMANLGDGGEEGDKKSGAIDKLTLTSLSKFNRDGLTPLMMAAKFGHEKILEYLLSTVPELDINKQASANFDKLSPLMLACQYGHLSVVKFLADEKNQEKYNVKFDLPDKRGKTALTHSVINGHSTIVSFLLRLGVNHLVADSSGNTLVLYAAAYGWYFILKLLMEAGCSLKDSNYWKLTPLAVAFKKSHSGLVEFILANGVDINSPVNDSTGVTLLLEMCTSKPSQDYLDKLKFLVEKQHADCKATDFEKNNALHKLVQVESDALQSSTQYSPYDGNKDQKCLFQAAKLLIRQGCDPLALNDDQMSPFSLAVKLGCFSLLKEVFMESEGGTLSTTSSGDNDGNTILHLLVPHLKDQVNLIYKHLSKNPTNLKNLTDMAAIRNKKGQTPLLLFLSTIKSSGRIQVSKSNQEDNEDESEQGSDEEEEENSEEVPKIKVSKPADNEAASAETNCIKSLLRFLVNQLQSDVNAVLENEDKSSVLHLAVECNGKLNLSKEILIILLAKKPNLEIMNGDSRTPLALSIFNEQEESSRLLIKAGAIVTVETGGKDKTKSKSLLLQACEHPMAGSFSLVPLLIEKGANVFGVDVNTGNSALHLICQRPTLPFALEGVKKIISSGFKLTTANKVGRTPLHLIVNSRGGETDATYEIEDALIEHSPQSLSLWDSRGRIPLHYAFVKMGKFSDSSFIDPIELVAIIVGAMKEANCRELIKSADKFGCSPLHYAATRGATISCSFLLTESSSSSMSPAIIDTPDKNGNTPFGLAVLNGHEGSALLFQQKQGNFTMSLNCERKKVDLDSFGASTKEKRLWEWNHNNLIEEEKRKKRSKENVYTILEKVVRLEWQGILHLMLESLKNSGSGISSGIYAAIKTHRYKLAMKLISRVKRRQELEISKKEGILVHILAKYGDGSGGNAEIEILNNLLLKGVDILTVDDHKSNALIYAAMQRNLNLCRKLMDGVRNKSTDTFTISSLKDNLGRTPFTALFHNLNEKIELSSDLKSWAKEILAYSSSSTEGDSISEFPLQLSDYPGVRYLQLETTLSIPNIDSKFTPLIASVIYGSFDTVKWLLTLKGKVDVNAQDIKGRTALMHAVRLNDIKMVKLLLSPKTYTPSEDTIPWDKTSYYNPTNTQVNLTIRDKSGLTVVDHLVRPSVKCPSYAYANSDSILRILSKLKVPLNEKSGDCLSPLDRALKLNRQHLSQAIQELMGIGGGKQINVAKEYENFVTIPEQSSPIPSTEYLENSQAMRKLLVEEEEAKQKVEEEGPTDPSICTSVTPDSLIGSDYKTFSVVMDEEQKIPFDCVLTKIDLTYGMYGLYNFYKMQILKKPKGKEMIILLFTRWGRVGDEGQYQQTPFITIEDAIKEFKKIFKAKSGNAWEESQTSVPLPKRYRLVQKELRFGQRKKHNEVKIDFNRLIESAKKNPNTKLAKGINELIEHLSLLHKSSVHLTGMDEHCEHLPFGLLTTDCLKKGEALLMEIEKLIAEKTKMVEAAGYDHTSPGQSEQGQKLMDKLIELSEEFYCLIPIYGFATEKLSPIFEVDTLRQKQDVIHSILHLQYASQVLLAAQFNVNNKINMNPFEYIYKCLGTKVQEMNRQEEEAQIILQYIRNTSDERSGIKIENIYRIERPGELEAMEGLGVKNRWLLFHGTKSVNLLSILNRGLQVAPIGSEISGHMFGKGIYFADMFTKSQGYCVGKGNRNFMLICEVALGNVHPVSVCYNSEDRKKPLPPECHSIQTSDSRYQPDPGTTIHYKGRTIPLGKRTTKVLGRDRYYGLDYNEFIIFNPAQVRLKYLIQFQ